MLNANLFRKGAPPLDRDVIWKSVKYAQAAIHFCALGTIARNNGFDRIWLFLYATSLELGLKSLALRWGVAPNKCWGHKVTKLLALIEGKGGCLPPSVRNFLLSDKSEASTAGERKKRQEKEYWDMTEDERFEAIMIDCRYPDMKCNAFIHRNYPGLVAELLEAESPYPLWFQGGSALAEIKLAVGGQRSKSGIRHTSSRATPQK